MHDILAVSAFTKYVAIAFTSSMRCSFSNFFQLGACFVDSCHMPLPSICFFFGLVMCISAQWSVSWSSDVYLGPVICILVQWCVSGPSNVYLGPVICISAQWCLFPPSDVYLGPVMCISAQWCVSRPSDVYLSPVMCILAQWSVSWPSVVHLGPVMCISAQWCVSLPSDVYLGPVMCISAQLSVSWPSDVYLGPVMCILALEGVHDVKLHHPSSSVATSNQWCWSGVRGNINKLLLIVVIRCILLLHILWSGLQVSQIGFCLTASISLWFC